MDTDEKLLLSRAEDALRLAEKRYGVKTLGFLTPRERIFLEKHLLASGDMQVFYDGGYEEAERTLLVCAPAFLTPCREEYLAVLECTGREISGLTHRDYLGSLMGLGIVRESIGDILVTEEKAFLFVRPEQTDYILQNLTKIGRCGVRLRVCSAEETEIPQRPTKDINTTVSALRLDSVLAAAIGVARGKSAELIRAGLVTVNWEPVEEVSRTLKEGDMLSVRGYGRMCLSRVGGVTRKGRCSVTISRYI
ncbi:MAG: YlmH/Sll1252 family protein [Clostridia bacterium]|nr:YlmH/Sll1252 family protein [Clostridia bacterium]